MSKNNWLWIGYGATTMSMTAVFLLLVNAFGSRYAIETYGIAFAAFGGILLLRWALGRSTKRPSR